MELQRLRYFLALAEELSFHRAAARLKMSQPPLSRQIVQLEKKLGVKLFNRTKRKVELTEAGQMLAVEARQVVARLNAAASIAAQAARGEVGHIIVAYNSANSKLVARVAKRFTERYPNVRVDLRNFTSQRHVDAILEGRFDVSFSSVPLTVSSKDLVVEPILREPLAVAMSPQHPLAARRKIAAQALSNEQFILFPRTASPEVYDLIIGYFRNAGIVLNVAYEMDNSQLILDLVSEGFGIAFNRASLHTHRIDIVFRRLQRAPVIELGLLYRRQNLSRVLPAFISIAKTIANEPASGR